MTRMPALFTDVSGSAFTLGLPQALAFAEKKDITSAGTGARERGWVCTARPGGGYCVVIAIEHPAFAGAFPESILEYYRLSGMRRKVVQNLSVPPPAGAVGAIEQESTFSLRLDERQDVPGHSYSRHFLTPGRTLLSLTVAAPEAAVVTCGLTGILPTFGPSGREFTAPRSER